MSVRRDQAVCCPDDTPFRCIIDIYLGAYAYWDLPNGAVDDTHRDLEQFAK